MSTVATALFSHTISTDRAYEEVLAEVQQKAADAGFRLMHVHDLAAAMAAKGFQREAYAVIEVCVARVGFEALAKDPLIGLFMPCKVNVWTAEGKTWVSTLKLAAAEAFFPGSDLGTIAAEVTGQLIAIVDSCQ